MFYLIMLCSQFNLVTSKDSKLIFYGAGGVIDTVSAGWVELIGVLNLIFI